MRANNALVHERKTYSKAISWMWAELMYRRPFGPAWRTVRRSNLRWWKKCKASMFREVFALRTVWSQVADRPYLTDWCLDRTREVLFWFYFLNCGPSRAWVRTVLSTNILYCGLSGVQVWTVHSTNFSKCAESAKLRFGLVLCIADRPILRGRPSASLFWMFLHFYNRYSHWDSCADGSGLYCNRPRVPGKGAIGP
jgi:hypothetical protein